MAKASQSATTRRKIAPLSRNSHIAMHRQLAQRLREAIVNGIYKPGERIPTEPELIERYGVSRITARQAVDHLAREGRVIRKQGKGTFVAEPVVRHDLLDLRGIYEELVAQGLDPGTEIIEFAETLPPPHVAERLQSGSRPLASWKRLYRLRGTPFALSCVYLSPGSARVTRAQAARHPTYSVLESVFGFRITHADISIAYQRATPELRKLLRLPAGAPVMVLERVSYSADGVPREHTMYYAKAESYVFSIKVRGKLPITESFREARPASQDGVALVAQAKTAAAKS
ncbi:MAG TPA: GntR family transcriptional regulator [Burkholderiales bacterium]|nr:GntR family transcriptional regulator [Burkholderiales bacterium]